MPSPTSALYTQARARLTHAFRALLSPPLCMACDALTARHGLGFCPDCAQDIYPVEGPLCFTCGQSLLELQGGIDSALSDLCPTCDAHPPWFEQARAPYRYNGALSASLQRIKYSAREDLMRQLSDWAMPALTEDLEAWRSHWGPLHVCPVPVSARSARTRGFHVPSVLARDVQRHLTARHIQGIDVSTTTLTRRGRSQAQAGLGLNQRRQNVHGVFKVTPAELDSPICLIDDVMTSGATVNEAARVLRQAGAPVVIVWSLTRRMAMM